MPRSDRRGFLKGAAAALAAPAVVSAPGRARAAARQFQVSVAGWSFHREVFGGKLKQLDLFRVVREEFDIGAFELVNNMLEVPTADYVSRIGAEAAKHAVVIPLIMIDSEGPLGAAEKDRRRKAVRDHQKWLYVASDLGCHSIRVNWGGAPSGAEKDSAKTKEFIDRSVESFGDLCALARDNGLNVIIENHGGPSSRPESLAALMKAVNLPNFGTLPDFGNFPADVDRYDAIDQLMPWAKAVSAKCYDFDSDGNETKIDFERMLRIVVDKHDYHGWIGIEFEGDRLSEREGVRAARDLLLKLRG